MKVTAVLCVLSLLTGGAALMSTPAEAAGWISSADSYAAPWVKEIEQEFFKQEYRSVFEVDPRTPQASVLRLLNYAASAYEANESAKARELLQEAIDVLHDGVRRHYYAQTDIEPLVAFIRQHAPLNVS